MEANNAKVLREALLAIKEDIFKRRSEYQWYISDSEALKKIDAALAAPPRNCDKVKDHSDAIGKFEKWMGFSPKTADEQDAFFKEHWFEFAVWLIDMNESETR